MTFKWLAFHTSPYLELELPVSGYLLVLIYALLTSALLIFSIRRTNWPDRSRWPLLALCLAAAPILAGLLVVGIPGPAGEASGFSLPLLILLPILAAALWLGMGPAILAGLLAGLSWTLFGAGQVTHPFMLALLGAGLSVVMGQRYRGRLPRWLRQPLVAALIGAAAAAWPLEIMGLFLAGQGSALVNLDRALGSSHLLLAAHLLAALTAGILLQVVLAWWAVWRPWHEADLIPPPWAERLSQRVLYTSVPVSVLVIVLLAGIVATTAYRAATRLITNQMAQEAADTSRQILFFFQMGRGLLSELSGDERLVGEDEEIRQTVLEDSLNTVPFFEQLVTLDSSGAAVHAALPGSNLPPFEISAEEGEQFSRTLAEGSTAEIAIYEEGSYLPLISFIVPIHDPESAVTGALIGRTTLSTNPVLGPVLDTPGEGFVIHVRDRQMIYPDHLSASLEGLAIPEAGAGSFFRQPLADGTRQLVYVKPVSDHPDWLVVLTAPNRIVLALALQIALPALLLTTILVAVFPPLIIMLVRQIADPLEYLAQATDQMAEGELERPLVMTGSHEIGRLNRAFEQMRARLKGRLHEQDRLLSVSRAVSSSLELFRAMPPILSSALDVTGAAGVRVALRRDGDKPLQTYSAGEGAVPMGILDTQLVDLVERQGTVVISQLWRASGSLDASALVPQIKALVALPLRSDTSFHGVMWLGYDHEHEFEESELNFLSTLAGQAAVAVANTRLFTEAQEGRRKLEAVLESTADGMIVVDRDGQIVLINPAAERYLGLAGKSVLGHHTDDTIDEPALAALMTDLQEPVAALELHRDGRTLLANTSTIVSQEGAITGRVAVLRDITALKELDNIKTVFLQMVSHDLRSPLTYMRGYVSMLPIDGSLNERQNEDLDRINAGIDHIMQMTERLTYLSRLQFGEEADLETVLLDVQEAILEAVDQHEGLARQKKINLVIEVEEKLPLLHVDGILYGQAITNLIHNALKYTLEGGQVKISAYHDGPDRVTVSVADTGIGIREEDQERLFEAFYRVPQREGDPQRPKGTGLGLALVRAIAEAHQGTVHVESEWERGSTFSITVPVGNIGHL